MKIFNLFVLIIITTLVLESCQSSKLAKKDQQEMTTELRMKQWNQQQITEDVDFFMEKMEEICPFPYLMGDSLEIYNIAQKIKSQPNVNSAKLYLDFEKLSGAYSVGHIYTSTPYLMLKKDIFDTGEKVFPLVLDKIKGKWFIENCADTSMQIAKGVEVLKINGKDINTLVDSFLPYMSRTLSLEDKIWLLGADLYFYLWATDIKPPFVIECYNSKTQQKEVHNSLGVSGLPYKSNYKMKKINKSPLESYITFELKNDSVAYINFKSMVMFDRSLIRAYDKFLKTTFQQLQEDGVKHLVIDLRYNRGGMGDIADRLLDYIANKPYCQASGAVRRVSQPYKDAMIDLSKVRKNILKEMAEYMSLPNGTNHEEFVELEPLKENKYRFKGKVWCLIGQGTYSAAMMMANAIEDFDLATLVGQPTGGIPNELSDALALKTPNSRIAFFAPSTMFTRANGDAKNPNHVQPDFFIEYGDDGKDTAMEFILQKIQGK